MPAKLSAEPCWTCYFRDGVPQKLSRRVPGVFHGWAFCLTNCPWPTSGGIKIVRGLHRAVALISLGKRICLAFDLPGSGVVGRSSSLTVFSADRCNS